jgi:hypothetical protein
LIGFTSPPLRLHSAAAASASPPPLAVAGCLGHYGRVQDCPSQVQHDVVSSEGSGSSGSNSSGGKDCSGRGSGVMSRDGTYTISRTKRRGEGPPCLGHNDFAVG